jgi:hypothetical protein
MPTGLKGYSAAASYEPGETASNSGPGETGSSKDLVDEPVLRSLSNEARQLTELRARVLQPVVRREAAMLHPVNGYELVEQALSQRTKPQLIPVRPFAVDTPRHVFIRQRPGPNFVLPVETAE